MTRVPNPPYELLCVVPDNDQPMTAADLDALEAVLAAATAGPWKQDVYEVVASRHRFVAETGWRPDAALIVAAVNALEPLLAEVRRGRAGHGGDRET